MKRTIPYWQVGGFLFTAVFGTLLHFIFDWTSGSVVSALFSAVNESIWEHLKLLFYPMMVFAFVEYIVWGKENPFFWHIKFIGILAGLMLIPVIYYTYTGICGVNVDWVNIAIFFLTAGAVYWLETKLLQRNFSCRLPSKWSLILLFSIAVLFTIFTFLTPRIPLFEDPMTGTYGFQS